MASQTAMTTHEAIRSRVPASPDGSPGHADEIAAVAATIADRFRPERIVLFGSHATGTAGDESDVDLLVVLETPLRPLKQAVAIYQAIEHRIPVDVLVRTPRQVAAPSPRDLILRDVLRDDVVLYEARD